jgi:hypothetical protein
MKDGKKTEGQLTMITATGLNVRASLRTPYLEDIALRLNHDGELRRFQSNGELSYGYKTASTQVNVNTKGILKIDGFYKTPYTEDIVFSTETTGSIRKFQSSGSASYNRKTVSYDISIDTLRDPEGTMTVRTPFTDDIAASFSHQGVLSNFLSHGDIEYSGRKQHEIVCNVTSGIKA